MEPEPNMHSEHQDDGGVPSSSNTNTNPTTDPMAQSFQRISPPPYANGRRETGRCSPLINHDIPRPTRDNRPTASRMPPISPQVIETANGYGDRLRGERRRSPYCPMPVYDTNNNHGPLPADVMNTLTIYVPPTAGFSLSYIPNPETSNPVVPIKNNGAHGTTLENRTAPQEEVKGTGNSADPNKYQGPFPSTSTNLISDQLQQANYGRDIDVRTEQPPSTSRSYSGEPSSYFSQPRPRKSYGETQGNSDDSGSHLTPRVLPGTEQRQTTVDTAITSTSGQPSFNLSLPRPRKSISRAPGLKTPIIKSHRNVCNEPTLKILPKVHQVNKIGTPVRAENVRTRPCRSQSVNIPNSLLELTPGETLHFCRACLVVFKATDCISKFARNTAFPQYPFLCTCFTATFDLPESYWKDGFSRGITPMEKNFRIVAIKALIENPSAPQEWLRQCGPFLQKIGALTTSHTC